MRETKFMRCGYCGCIYDPVDGYEWEPKVYENINIDSLELGMCASKSCQSENSHREVVTRDMAMDAGDPNLEGTYL